MYCKHCGVEVVGAARVCPLCHRPLDEDNLNYPIIKKTGKKKSVTFSFVYILISLIASVVCLTVNLVLPYQFLWALPVVALLVYGFIIFVTVFSKRNAGTKIFLQTAALVAVAYSLENLSPSVRWAATYAVPFLIVFSGILLMILSLTTKRAGQYVLYLIIVVLLGSVPLIYNLVVGGEVLWPTIMCAVCSGALLIFALLYGFLAGNGVLKEEIKRKFHL